MGKARDEALYATVRTHKQVASSVQEIIDDAVGGDLDGLHALIQKLLNVETYTEGRCDKCGEMSKLASPDWKGAKAMLELLLGYVIGKPTQRTELVVEETHHHNVTLQQIKDMDTAELELIRDGKKPIAALVAGNAVD